MTRQVIALLAFGLLTVDILAQQGAPASVRSRLHQAPQ